MKENKSQRSVITWARHHEANSWAPRQVADSRGRVAERRIKRKKKRKRKREE
jgi:hypothetical protein